MEEEYLQINKVINDEKVTSTGMSQLQTVLIAVGIALIFIGVVLVLFKYHLPKQKQMPNCLLSLRFSSQSNQPNRDIAQTMPQPQPPRVRVKKRPNVY